MKQLNKDGQNTFKFASFNDRLQRVKVRTKNLQNDSQYIPDEGFDSFFHQELTHWKELNLTRDFGEFCRQADPWTHSLALILFHKDEIIDLLIQHLSKPDTMAFQPLLDLTATLSKDLEEELYPHFVKLYQTILPFLHANDVEKLDASFNALAHLIRCMATPLTDDIKHTWSLMKPLFSDEKPYVRAFASQSFGFLLRRTTQVDILKEMMNSLESRDINLAEGLALVYFEAVKQVGSGFHSRGIPLLKSLIPLVSENSPEDNYQLKTLRILFLLLASQLDKTNMTHLLKVCIELSGKHPGVVLVLLNTLVTNRKGAKLETLKPLYELAVSLHGKPTQDWIEKEYYKFVAALVYTSSPTDLLVAGKKMLDTIFSHYSSKTLAWIKIAKNMNEESYAKVILPMHLEYLARFWNQENDFACLSSLENVVFETNLSHCSAAMLDQGKLRIQNTGIEKHFTRALKNAKKVDWKSATMQEYAYYYANFSIAQHASFKVPDVSQLLTFLISQAEAYRLECQDNDFIHGWSGYPLHLLISQLVEIVSPDKTLTRNILSWFTSVPRLPQALSAIKSIPNLPQEIIPLIKDNLCIFDHEIRLTTLQVLNAISKDEVIPILLEIEELPNDITHQRQKSILFDKLIQLITNKSICKPLLDLIPLHCLGSLSVGFSPLWKDAIRTLVAFGKLHGPLFWQHYSRILNQFDSNDTIGLVHIDSLLPLDEIDEPLDVTSPRMDDQSKKKHVGDVALPLLAYDSPSLAKLNRVSKVFNLQASRLLCESFVQQSNLGNQHVEWWTVFGQLIRVMQDLPQVAQQHLDYFVNLLKVVAEKEEDLATHSQTVTHSTIPSIDTKIARDKLVRLLELFSKIKTPVEVRPIFLNLLTRPDDRVQALALDSILVGNHADLGGLKGYSDTIKDLIDDQKIRDALVQLNVEELIANVQPHQLTILMDIIVRLLYGKLTSRQKQGRGKRLAILAFLANASRESLDTFVSLMTEPLESMGSWNQQSTIEEVSALSTNVPPRRPLGFLMTLGEFLKQLRTKSLPYFSQFFHLVISILVSSDDQSNDSDDESDEEFEKVIESKRSKLSRTHALRRLVDLFDLNLDFNYQPFVDAILKWYIAPRVPTLATAHSQARSGLLNLVMTWAKHPQQHIHLLQIPELLPTIFSMLSSNQVAIKVTLAIVSMMESILQVGEDSMELEPVPGQDVFSNHEITSAALNGLQSILERCLVSKGSPSPSNLALSRRVINVLSHLSRIPAVKSDSKHVVEIVKLSLIVLTRPTRLIPENVKGGILTTMANFLPVYFEEEPIDVKDSGFLSSSVYASLSRLFSVITSSESRNQVVLAMKQFTGPTFERVNSYISDLNAMRTDRLDEADFDKKFGAFADINNKHYPDLTAIEWLPLLHNFIFFIQDEQEFAVRTNASYGLQRFVQACHQRKDAQFDMLLEYTLIPAIKRGLKHHRENVRQEWVAVLDKAVEEFPTNTFFSTLVPLRGEDEEASILGNIYHLQLHRRIRALRRLSQLLDQNQLVPIAINHVVVPLVLHFVYEADKIKEHNVVNEAITTLASASRWLPWGQYYSLVRTCLKSINKRPAIEKTLIRVVVAVLDQMEHRTTQEVGEADSDDEQFPEKMRIQNVIVDKLLPELFQYLKQDTKDQETISIRVPVALAIAKLLKSLPQDLIKNQLSKLVVSLCQLMKSKLQDVRDSTRSTLVKINQVLGPRYLGVIVDELKNALTRGPQLHVLGYTIHVLLTEMTSQLQPGDLNEPLSTITSILMDDIFGETGEEKEIEIVANKMKETKATRSFDSFELLARNIDFQSGIASFLQPIRQVMESKDDVKSIQHVGNILKRIATGLTHNPSVQAQDLLIFIQGLLTESLPVSKVQEDAEKSQSQFEKTFTILPPNPHQLASLGRSVGPSKSLVFANHAFQFVEFGQSLLLNALKRDKISKTPEMMAMINPMIPILGESLFSKHSIVTIGALKILSILVKYPGLSKFEQDLPVMVKRVFDIVSKSSSTGTDLIQNCFRFITIVMRDTSIVKITQRQIIGLIRLIQPDLQDMEKQSTTFGLIKAILGQKIVVEEVYDLMDQVAQIMITSQTTQVREVCRQTWLQFLLDYPHGHGRLKTLFTFLTNNLEYRHLTGRESAMEMMNVLFEKLNDAVLFEFAEQFAMALVMSLVNDEEASCREMAATLLKKLMQRLDSTRLDLIWSVLMKWSRSEISTLQRAAMQVMGLILETNNAERYASKISLDSMLDILSSVAEAMEDGDVGQWQLAYATLVTISKLLPHVQHHSAEWDSVWNIVIVLLIHPHAWVRLQSARLLGQHVVGVDTVTGMIGKHKAHAIISDEAIQAMANKLIIQLKSPNLTPEASAQAVKLLFFVGKRLLSHPHEEFDFAKLVRKFIGMVRQEQSGKGNGTMQRTAAFQWFAAMSNVMTKEQLELILEDVVMVLYQTSRDETFKGNEAEELKGLAQEVLDLLQKRAGQEVYMDTYNRVHQTVVERRKSRKEEKVVMAVANPMQATKRKLQRHEMKKAGKKRKIEESKKRRRK